MSNSEELIKKTDIREIAEKGSEIYDKLKAEFEPDRNGKFLAIDIDSEDTYLANTSSEAVEIARKAHPNKVFYVVRIGYSVAETLANLSCEK
jgi:hypothetical protein